MDMHRDKHSGFTIVLVFGVLIEGFMQLYPTSGGLEEGEGGGRLVRRDLMAGASHGGEMEAF